VVKATITENRGGHYRLRLMRRFERVRRARDVLKGRRVAALILLAKEIVSLVSMGPMRPPHVADCRSGSAN
jgi:hypothetical protein